MLTAWLLPSPRNCVSSTLLTLGEYSVARSYSLKKAFSKVQLHLFFPDSSEANDLALRLACQYTQHEDVVVLDQ